MTHRILKSAIAAIPNFATRAAAHGKEMRDWRAQMKLAAEHKGNDKIPEIERYVERPMPREIPLVEAAVNEDDVIDFEVVDDGPTSDQVLAMKKAVLVKSIELAEAAAIDVVFPAGKARLIGFRRSDIAASDVALIAAAQKNIDDEFDKLLAINTQRTALWKPKPGLVGSIVKVVTGPSAADIADDVALKALDLQAVEQDQKLKELRAEWSNHQTLLARMRSPVDHDFMVDHAARMETIESIRRWAAQMLSDVADLTAETADGWKITPFQS